MFFTCAQLREKRAIDWQNVFDIITLSMRIDIDRMIDTEYALIRANSLNGEYIHEWIKNIYM